jgi:hypothetical protein
MFNDDDVIGTKTSIWKFKREYVVTVLQRG